MTALRSALPITLAVAFATGVAAAMPDSANAQFSFDSDTVSFRWEIGATTDVTNELFYEDAFIDTTFIGRRTVSTPETRVAGVLLAGVQGTRGTRATQYALHNELRVGDKLQRNITWLRWRTDLTPRWRLAFNPSLEFKSDQTFSRDLREARGVAGARLRRMFDDGITYADWRVTGEFLRTGGDDADFLPDRNEVRTGLALDRLAVFGSEWRVGYRLAARQFPDSTVRDHFEQGWEGRWRYNFQGGHALLLETDGARRVTMRTAPNSRDNFWQEWIRGELLLRANDVWAWRTRAGIDGLQYDVQDTVVYFNYVVTRIETGPRFDRGSRWVFGFGPVLEVLRSELNPAEAYVQLGGQAEVEFLGSTGWWSLLPAAGWREYEDRTGAQDPLAIHSSYAFYEMTLFGDQRIPGGLRLRTITTMRREEHTLDVDDATSLYFSIDVRRIF